jgi:hypothetical protein
MQISVVPALTQEELQDGPAPFVVSEGAVASRENIVLVAVMQHLEEMFDAIRDGMREYQMTNYIRSALLQPLAGLSVKQVRAATIGVVCMGCPACAWRYPEPRQTQWACGP